MESRQRGLVRAVFAYLVAAPAAGVAAFAVIFFLPRILGQSQDVLYYWVWVATPLAIAAAPAAAIFTAVGLLRRWHEPINDLWLIVFSIFYGAISFSQLGMATMFDIARAVFGDGFAR